MSKFRNLVEVIRGRIRRYTLRMMPFFFGVIASSLAGCAGKQDRPEVKKEKAAAAVNSPPGYDLGAPVKYVLGETLRKISGIAFLRGNPDTLYATEDETGRLYFFHLGGGAHTRHFGGRGDYKDVTVLDDKEFVVLCGDGSLIGFPVGAAGRTSVRVYQHILPAGQYEGLFGDKGGRLIAMCKNCGIDGQTNGVSAYVLGYDANHSLGIRDHFRIMPPGDKLTGISQRTKFHPSCLARHPLTGEWYVVSAVNRVLIVFDEHWKARDLYALDATLFKQPEGLAFDRDGNMYISNAGGEGRANVLLFRYKR